MNGWGEGSDGHSCRDFNPSPLVLPLAGYHITPIFVTLALTVAWDLILSFDTSGSPVADGISAAEGYGTSGQS